MINVRKIGMLLNNRKIRLVPKTDTGGIFKTTFIGFVVYYTTGT